MAARRWCAAIMARVPRPNRCAIRAVPPERRVDERDSVMNSRWIAIAAALPLAACAASGSPAESTPAAPPAAMACNADAVQAHIGHKATPEAGATLLQESGARRSEEHTSELPSLMRISYAVFCLQKKKQDKQHH